MYQGNSHPTNQVGGSLGGLLTSHWELLTWRSLHVPVSTPSIPHHTHLHPMAYSLCTLPTAARTNFCRKVVNMCRKSNSVGLGETSLEKAKERLSAPRDVQCRMERSLRILPQEKGKWSRHIHRRSEKASESLVGLKEVISLLKSVGEDKEGDCYFKWEESNSRLQRTWKIKEMRYHQKKIKIFQ